MKTLMISLLCLALAPSAFAGKTRVVEKRVATTPGQRIEINGISGSKVTFTSWDKDEVYVRLTVEVSSSDAEYENDVVSSAAIDDVQAKDAVRLTFREGGSLRKSGSWLSRLFGQFFVNNEISGEVYVPKKNALRTDMKYGSMTLDGMAGDVELLGASNSVSLRNCAAVRRVENNYGTTRIEASGGALRLTGSSSKVTVADFAGSLDIDANYSTVSITHVSADVSVTDQSGKVSVDDVGGSATLDANYSTVSVYRVKGAVSVQSASGTVRLRDVGGADVQANYSAIDILGVTGAAGKPVYVRSQSGHLTLEDVAGNVSIDNPYSTMSLARIQGNVALNSTSATIEAADVTGDWKSQTQYSTITLRQLSAKSVSVANSSNPVKIALKTVPSAVTIQNTYGSVRMSMPGGFSGDVDLDAEYGTVETNLPIKVRTRSGSGSATGRIGAGTGTISIETKSGNIDLEEKEPRASAD
jgi:DUF4097 and DUF4098 domain-containing protein YvlB